jgi:hypothetical protein
MKVVALVCRTKPRRSSPSSPDIARLDKLGYTHEQLLGVLFQVNGE